MNLSPDMLNVLAIALGDGHDLTVETHDNLLARYCRCWGALVRPTGRGGTCAFCGGLTIPTGSCETCTTCGTSGGCG
jgi:hypothetical protein